MEYGHTEDQENIFCEHVGHGSISTDKDICVGQIIELDDGVVVPVQIQIIDLTIHRRSLCGSVAIMRRSSWHHSTCIKIDDGTDSGVFSDEIGGLKYIPYFMIRLMRINNTSFQIQYLVLYDGNGKHIEIDEGQAIPSIIFSYNQWDFGGGLSETTKPYPFYDRERGFGRTCLFKKSRQWFAGKDEDTRMRLEHETERMTSGETIHIDFPSLLKNVIKMIRFKINFLQDEPVHDYITGTLEDDSLIDYMEKDHVLKGKIKKELNKIKLYDRNANNFNVELYNSTCLFSQVGYSHQLVEKPEFKTWANHLVNEVRYTHLYEIYHNLFYYMLWRHFNKFMRKKMDIIKKKSKKLTIDHQTEIINHLGEIIQNFQCFIHVWNEFNEDDRIKFFAMWLSTSTVIQDIQKFITRLASNVIESKLDTAKLAEQLEEKWGVDRSEIKIAEDSNNPHENVKALIIFNEILYGISEDLTNRIHEILTLEKYIEKVFIENTLSPSPIKSEADKLCLTTLPSFCEQFSTCSGGICRESVTYVIKQPDITSSYKSIKDDIIDSFQCDGKASEYMGVLDGNVELLKEEIRSIISQKYPSWDPVDMEDGVTLQAPANTPLEAFNKAFEYTLTLQGTNDIDSIMLDNSNCQDRGVKRVFGETEGTYVPDGTDGTYETDGTDGTDGTDRSGGSRVLAHY